ncbi:MAG: hypothetical protein WBO24_02290 [Nitrospirales bacterium]
MNASFNTRIDEVWFAIYVWISLFLGSCENPAHQFLTLHDHADPSSAIGWAKRSEAGKRNLPLEQDYLS